MTYYNNEVNEVLAALETSENGLDKEEAKARLDRYGYNKLKERHKKTKLQKFMDQFKDMMILILIIAAIFSGISSYVNGESYTDTIIILAVVIINAFMGYFQELKAESAIESLKKMTKTNTKVIRNGELDICNAEELVPGDIIELEAGDKIPADGRVIDEVASCVDESMLTGESDPVGKDEDKIDGEVQINERCNMIYSGTSLVNGKITAVVTETGMKTELGKIASTIQKDKEVLTPLQIKINNISKTLSILIGLVILGMLAYGIFAGNNIVTIIMLCISLAVAAIPEGLPAVITITLSLGATSMAKKRTIIRKISSVETLGSVNVICSDKTGTITQNKMQVKELVYNLESHIATDKPVENSELFTNLMILCNDTKVDEGNLIGDPTETALFKYAMDVGIDPEKIVDEYERIAEIPFDSDRKMMTTINTINSENVVCTKGSLDSLLSRSKYVLLNGEVKDLTKEDKEKIFELEKGLADKSLRVLGFAYRVVSEVPEEQDDIDDLENDLIFVGLVGMMDPPRESVKESITICKEAGILPVMITGDSLSTAKAIAKEIGIIENEETDGAIEGKELDKFSDEQLIREVRKYRVYARVQPEHKVRIVKAWQSNGKVVAMTGDGVNDAPAIKLAHVGIGMGQTGTEVTKNVADVILMDDSFNTIVDAIGEGRKIYDNIRNDIVYSLSSNFAEMAVVIIGLLCKVNIFLPLHILYIDLATDSIPSICLAFEKEAKGIMKRSPKPVNRPFFTPFVTGCLAVSAVLEAVLILITYFTALKLFGHEVAQTMSFLSLIIQEMCYAINCRNLKEPILKQGLFSNKAMNIGMLVLVLMQILVFATPIGTIFKIVPLNMMQVGAILASNLLVFVLIDLSKYILRKFFKD